MTNYNQWDKKASDLAEEAEKEEEEDKKKSDEALGLQDGPQGPPVAKAKAQRKEMGQHSEGRRNFIAEQQAREQVITHTDEAEPVVLTAEQAQDRAVRLRGSKNVSYEVPKDITVLKLFVEGCTNVKVKLNGHITTQFLEINHSEDCEVRAEEAVSTVQCDECEKGFVRITYMEPENVGTFYHQNSPALEVQVGGEAPTKIGQQSQQQLFTRPGPSGEMQTEPVIRAEKDFPAQLGRPQGVRPTLEPDAELLPTEEENREKAEAKRAEGNEAFKASDFLQGAVYYTEAIQLCPELHLAYANRAACFLKTGSPDKALEDATRCTELVPGYAKGWFRKGMALHALKKFGQAIPALTEAEKLEPKNDQIPEAIKMAQLMCRKHGPGDD